MRFLLALLLSGVVLSASADHAVILMYHHVDENTPASTSVRPEQFRRQLDYIQENGFVVMPLKELLDAIYGGGEVPENAVAITFDDAYESVHRVALPELVSRAMPFTVFVATKAVERGYDGSMSWQDLAELADSGLATFGAHSISHEHLLRGSETGVTDDWTKRVSAEIDHSAAVLKQKFAELFVPAFAYPFGEYSPALQALVEARNYYGLAQQSGALGASTATTEIPRFPMAQSYDSLERLAMALNTRPLPVADVQAGQMFIADISAAPQELRFTLTADGPYRREQLACYSSTGEALALTREAAQFTVALPPFRAGRNKVNCTAPSTERGAEFFWYARQWVLADDEGRWLKY
ncbi:polysaccharide deacetylase family protein [Parahaliea sp. F7430]|uniref:Polysaccharide deacetylase family protein n=1 Tax=Sediminihaliea albiluteola TaxID=2758564 RepID=A0A7W2YIY1_9GAMM|nr:polysaccharide deacetylase family protein [Sediminihaliea albiluteola]MBA6411723.1 polysaccharide deacetylase family protein [Sediminihaliea albiluteola]